MTVLAHPTDVPRRVTHHEGIRRDVPRHHRARSNHGVGADRMSANNRRIGPDRGAPFDTRRTELILARHGTARIDDVREHAAGPEEDIVLAGHARVDRDVVLHLHAIAQHDARRDDNVLPNRATLANDAPRHEVRKMPHHGAASNAASGIDHSRLVGLKFFIHN